jgi:hypothetical protein
VIDQFKFENVAPLFGDRMFASPQQSVPPYSLASLWRTTDLANLRHIFIADAQHKRN